MKIKKLKFTHVMYLIYKNHVINDKTERLVIDYRYFFFIFFHNFFSTRQIFVNIIQLARKPSLSLDAFVRKTLIRKKKKNQRRFYADLSTLRSRTANVCVCVLTYSYEFRSTTFDVPTTTTTRRSETRCRIHVKNRRRFNTERRRRASTS